MIQSILAAVAELADALDSGSSRGNPLDVQVISAAKLFFQGGFPIHPLAAQSCSSFKERKSLSLTSLIASFFCIPEKA